MKPEYTNLPDAPLLKPVIHSVTDTKLHLQSRAEEESQVIIHCLYTSGEPGELIRIWRSTFLTAHEQNHKSKLVHTENISLYPVWTEIKAAQTIKFTLVFTGLPKSCKMFNLLEDIPEPGGFSIPNIKRNKTDVYRVTIK